MAYESRNPVLSEKKFEQNILDGVLVTGEQMTVKGTIRNFGFLMIMLLGSFYFSWKQYSEGGNVVPYLFGGAIVGFILAIVMSFKPRISGYLAPAYALAEGFFVGAISAMYNERFAERAPNIVVNAVLLTLVVAFVMLLLYRFQIIRATEKFRSVIIGATVAIAIFYLLVFVMRMFGFDNMTFLHESSPLGIGFSLVVTAVAALNLILDFDTIENGAKNGAPKYMEWYGAFGLLVTLVWLYLEILRLLSKFSKK